MKRRRAIKNILVSTTGLSLTSLNFDFADMEKRAIPSSGEMMPVVGIGTWQTFDVGNDVKKRLELKRVLTEVYKQGGKFIDCSPMYGSSEECVGDIASELNFQEDFFYATKVWTSGRQNGIDQMNQSFRLMKRETMDLMQIHNLVDWEIHVKILKEWKDAGRIKYWGITHYTDRSHDQLAQIIKAENPDFVQFNYSINDRHAEQKLLGVAAEHGTAVVINRPFGGGELFKWAKGKKLPEWCKDYSINSWAQFFLKYILADPSVTCVIPGTGKVEHAIDNMQAGYNLSVGKDLQKKLLKTFMEKK
ncbi:aldo/keto reductase [Portibacter lacus]|uniref:Aldo/keto reductase n=1 Tax=Portibacter lacus TaxID=1099794 RepID=A0AA37SPU8_9BACT|nr:aldo/keto reductase [Portibacter lacus]GLR17972.1 aldo/keto reductase [Portibacter lacus]